jgi:hypothetical protein
MGRAQRRLGWTIKKKSLIAIERDEELRDAWWEQMARIDATQLVFTDESGINIAMTPRYARAPKGQRAYGYIPRVYGQNVTLIAALSLQGIIAAMTFARSRHSLTRRCKVRTWLSVNWPVILPPSLLGRLSALLSWRCTWLRTTSGC